MKALFRLLLLTLYAPVSGTSQQAWEDHLKRFASEIEITVPAGTQVLGFPDRNAQVLGQIQEASQTSVIGFVQSEGFRFYVTSKALTSYYQANTPPPWIYAGGAETLPPLPELIQRAPAIDPDTGEDIVVEIYQNEVQLADATQWPLERAEYADFAFAARVESVEPIAPEGWKARFALYQNPDAIASGMPFAGPSFNEMMSGAQITRQRLLSSPAPKIHTLTGSSNSANILGILKPGTVFFAAFDSAGRMRRLAAGGDAFRYRDPVSRLGHPAFLRENGLLSFRFKITTMTSSPSLIRFTPDRISGADYTQYSIIEDLGFPFAEATVNSADFVTNWGIEISSDETLELIAPIYDSRGAPGMIELEGLQLDPDPNPVAVTMTREEFADRLPPEWTPGELGPDWGMILKNKIGTIPDAQRVPEVAPY